MTKIENCIGYIRKVFKFKGLFDITINDDKLLHFSDGFRDRVLQIMGFMGIYIVPVMNGMGDSTQL